MLRITFWHSDKPRERILADAFQKGIEAAGFDTCELRALEPTVSVADCDLACMVGVKSAELWRAHVEAGRHCLMLDKGYSRHAMPGDVKQWEYWRVAVNSHQPTRFIERSMGQFDDTRSFPLQLPLQAWRKEGSKILLAGSSEKYHAFHKLSHPTRWATKVIEDIRAIAPDKEIVYRPKPSWREAEPIAGATYSRYEPIEKALAKCWAMVTHGSNACFESVICGIPVIVLGNAIAKPISSTELEQLVEPRLATFAERHQWLNAVAYSQWRMPEFASGEAWATIRGQVYG